MFRLANQPPTERVPWFSPGVKEVGDDDDDDDDDDHSHPPSTRVKKQWVLNHYATYTPSGHGQGQPYMKQ